MFDDVLVDFFFLTTTTAKVQEVLQVTWVLAAVVTWVVWWVEKKFEAAEATEKRIATLNRKVAALELQAASSHMATGQP